MQLNELLEKVNATPELIEFNEVMAVISANYHYQPCAFKNGELTNLSGTNEGSCKIFAFAQLQGLSKEATLACFGHYYREDVMLNSAGTDHGNIRNFIKQGWQGINFFGVALS
ncbi:MAG: hypothetical protein ACI952_002134 [Flavobacteriales bacterium]|jgi:hypothetical protein